METYELKVVCSNCGKKQNAIIPKGTRFFDHNPPNHSGLGEDPNKKFLHCNNCECPTLKQDTPK